MTAPASITVTRDRWRAICKQYGRYVFGASITKWEPLTEDGEVKLNTDIFQKYVPTTHVRLTFTDAEAAVYFKMKYA